MLWLNDRLMRVRWLTVPIAAYLLITIVLPFANAGAIRRDFLHHAGWVIAGCAAMIGIAIAGGLVVELASLGARKVSNIRGSRNVGDRS